MFRRKTILIIFSILAAVLAAGGYFYFGRKQEPKYEFIVVSKGDLAQEVSVTGRVRPAESADLAFEKSGRVKAVYADVGQKVIVGQPLVALDNSELSAQLKQAEANVKAERAKLDELKRGTRPEDIEVQQVKVKNYEIALEDAKRNLVDKLQDVYIKADDAVRNKTDQFFSNPRTNNPRLVFSASDQLKTDAESRRLRLESVFIFWKQKLGVLSTESDLASYLLDTKKNSAEVQLFLDQAALLVNGLTANSQFSQATVDSWKSDVSAGRVNVNTAVNNLTAADEKLRTAESNLTLGKQELLLKKAGVVPEQIAAQEAKVESALANAENLQAQTNKTFLRSPINGMVSEQKAKVGEIAAANAVIISLISIAYYEVEANIAEADIAKVKIGQTARVTLDAYGNDVIFQVRAVEIDPAETIIDGVATYKTTFQFMEQDGRIKSGMTANIDIFTDRRQGVIVVPQRAVISKNGDKIVRLIESPESSRPAVREIKVKTGLRGSDGNIEIREGVKEGDKVIIFSE